MMKPLVIKKLIRRTPQERESEEGSTGEVAGAVYVIAHPGFCSGSRFGLIAAIDDRHHPIRVGGEVLPGTVFGFNYTNLERAGFGHSLAHSLLKKRRIDRAADLKVLSQVEGRTPRI